MDNQGQFYAVQDAAGYTSYRVFDDEDRVTNSYDANGVSIAMTYDDLGRLLTRAYGVPGGPDLKANQMPMHLCGAGPDGWR